MDLQNEIDALWERRDQLGPDSKAEADLVREAIGLLDSGQVRIAELPTEGTEVVVNEWLKRAILLFFKVSAIEVTELGPFEYADRLPLKHGFREAGVRSLEIAGRYMRLGGSAVSRQN